MDPQPGGPGENSVHFVTVKLDVPADFDKIIYSRIWINLLDLFSIEICWYYTDWKMNIRIHVAEGVGYFAHVCSAKRTQLSQIETPFRSYTQKIIRK